MFLEYKKEKSRQHYFMRKCQWEILKKKVWCFTMANPTSAFFNAGASLVPSPVTATTSRCLVALLLIIPSTKVNLSFGVDRANTRKLGQILSSRIWDTCPCSSLINRLNSFPSNTRLSSPSAIIPHFRAIERAVSMLSPVIIRTVTPAPWHRWMAFGTSVRTGSSTPKIAKHVKDVTMDSSWSKSGLPPPIPSPDARMSRYATQRVRRPLEAMEEITVCEISAKRSSVNGYALPDSSRTDEQLEK